MLKMMTLTSARKVSILILLSLAMFQRPIKLREKNTMATMIVVAVGMMMEEKIDVEVVEDAVDAEVVVAEVAEAAVAAEVVVVAQVMKTVDLEADLPVLILQETKKTTTHQSSMELPHLMTLRTNLSRK